MKKTLLLAALTMVVSAPTGVLGSTGVSVAAEQRGAAGPGAILLGYLTPTITVSKGDSIAFTNFDAFEHNIVHDVEVDGFGGKAKAPWCKGPAADGHDHSGPCPVFWSELVGAGQTTQVLGLNRVKPGKTYSFFCSKHHSMKGELVVAP